MLAGLCPKPLCRSPIPCFLYNTFVLYTNHHKVLSSLTAVVAGIGSLTKVLGKLKCWSDDGARRKVRGSIKPVGNMNVWTMTIHPLVVEIVQSSKHIAIPTVMPLAWHKTTTLLFLLKCTTLNITANQIVIFRFLCALHCGQILSIMWLLSRFTIL